MNRFILLFLCSIFSFRTFSAEMCKLESGKFICVVPECPVGTDCQVLSDQQGPSIDSSSIQVTFEPPLRRWSLQCQLPARRVCWESQFLVNLAFKAKDNSALSTVSIEVALESDGKRAFKNMKTESFSKIGDLISVSFDWKEFLLPSQKMEMSVIRVCVTDVLRNENCEGVDLSKHKLNYLKPSSHAGF